jgi:hypothetical protein
MSSGIDWLDLERRGLIASSPGREEAVKAAQERSAAKKAAQNAPKFKPK